jgi:hypothetical protein
LHKWDSRQNLNGIEFNFCVKFADRFEEIAKMKENPKSSNNSNNIGENRPLRVQDWERINKQWDDERRAFRESNFILYKN